MNDINIDELRGLQKINLSDIKIISTTGTPSSTMVLCDGKELKGIKTIKFEMNTDYIVGKVTLEIMMKDVIIDTKQVEVTIIEKEGQDV